MDYKQEYVRYKHVLYGEYKSKKYLAWVKEKYPNQDTHHLLMKKIDYLVIPLEHFFHLEVVHKNRQKYFVEYLPMSLKILALYAFEMYGVEFDISDITPELVKQMIETVYKLDLGE
jgi:hypothetical protein